MFKPCGAWRTLKSEGHGSEAHVQRTRSTDATLIIQLLRHNLTTSTSDQEPAKTDEPATTEAVSAMEPAAESSVETVEDEIADKAEEPNTDEIEAKESAALTPRRDDWSFGTSRHPRKVMIQVLPNRVCSITAERTDHPPCPRKVLQDVTCRISLFIDTP